MNVDELTPRQIVTELDKHIIGQNEAKKSVAIAIRNRIRRRLLDRDLQEDIYPKNIIMIGPTGCGKTEIARRLSRLTGAPFVKVEATKYTEVGYVGRDVESMVRDLVNTSMNMVRKSWRKKYETEAQKNTRERLLDMLMPSSHSTQPAPTPNGSISGLGEQVQNGLTAAENNSEAERKERAREMLGRKLDNGELEDREVQFEISANPTPMVQVMGNLPPNMEDLDMHLQNMLGDFMPRKARKRKLAISQARKIILEEEIERLIDPDKLQEEAVERTEQLGIIFIDEIDKICGRGAAGSGGGSGPEVSREGVQRDLLPIVEGATVQTRQGPVKTDHILFIAAGAFHTSKPSDLIPELQGRFPIRVELEKLSEADFSQILTGPRNSLTTQVQSLMGTEGIELDFTGDGIDEIARFAFEVNERTENIGARRLHTIMEHLLEEISFTAPELQGSERKILIDRNFVHQRLHDIVADTDLARYIL
ncbi:MAG: ATP-dependent protease ATPase subunit HslU [Leptospiraceae bacterium]|nr:ATP-dependent protease ATPase subunit HslU [Leptospiraceae bacterium]